MFCANRATWVIQIGCILFLCSTVILGETFAGTAIPLLSGFDQERIGKAFPPEDNESLGELCKLIYRIRGADEKTLGRLASESPPGEAGDAIQLQGTLGDAKRVQVPQQLQEYLNFRSIYFLQIQNNEKTFRVITSRFPTQAKAGDRIQVTGVVLAMDSKTSQTSIACGNVGWFPNREMSGGEKLLESSGFNLSLLAGLSDRNRLPLSPLDGDAFYSMIATAQQLTTLPNLPAPKSANPITFLRDGKDLIADWIQMEIEGVQVTKIAVTTPERQEQLGSDHYFQIDAIGDLGEVVVKVEPEAGEEPVVFKTRYPISIVIRELPEFLTRVENQGPAEIESIVRPLRGKLLVKGFFFRLWAYESEFMQQQGGSSQFGPLLIASELRDLEPSAANPIGVEKIGYAAATAILLGMVGIWFWLRNAGKQDLQVKQKRRSQQAINTKLNFTQIAESQTSEEQGSLESSKYPSAS